MQRPLLTPMDILYLLIGCSITMALVFLAVFAWAVCSGQFDDTVTPAHRMLLEGQGPLTLPQETIPPMPTASPDPSTSSPAPTC